MATIRPFKAARPVRDKVHLVASRSYISYSWQTLHRKLNENPYTFIHIINPEYNKKDKHPPNSPGRFRKVRERYEEFVKDGVFKRDPRNAFYIYRQQKGNHTWTGIVGCASTHDYDKNIIKKHEKTLEKREQIFTRYLELTRINAEPVLMTYPDDREIYNMLRGFMGRFPEYDYTTMDQVRHTLWVVDDQYAIDYIRERFGEFRSLYIADGHHRSASSARLARNWRSEGGSPNALYNYFLSLFLPESSLKIFPFHRLLKDLGGWKEADLVEELKKHFSVILFTSDKPDEPQKLKQIGFMTAENYYCLEPLKGSYDENDPVKSLDVSILSENILKPYWDIRDQTKDQRVEFAGGEKQYENVAQMIRSGRYGAAFLLHPITMKQLKRVSDNNRTLPPKSTFIEPKLRSGLTVFEF